MGGGRAWRGAVLAVGALLGVAARADDGGGAGGTRPAWIVPGWDGPPWLAPFDQPPGWTSGDAAVVLLSGPDWPPAARDALRAALLGAGAAVLDPPPGLPAARLAEALRGLHRDQGAGLLVVIGMGEAVPVAPRLAATIHLGPGAPAFLPGEVPPGEDWPRRAPLLCDLLAAPPLPDARAACCAALSGGR